MKRRDFMKLNATAILTAALPCGVHGDNVSASNKPNIVLIMADDMGYSDIGCYGSEVETPALDRMGNNGMRFTQFYNMAKCNPTRSSLLTGLYFGKNHSNNACSLAQLMRRSGYFAATSGKEHFDGWVPERCYAKNSFDKSFVFWACTQYFQPPWGFRHPFRLDGKVVNPADMPLSERPFYKTDAVTDYALRFLDQSNQSGKPFFLYLPYHVAHYPLQARPEDIEKYRGKYMQGWDVCRKERFARQRELGVLPPNATLSEPEDNIYPHRGDNEWADYTRWEEVPEGKKRERALKMSVFAAMIDRMDQNIARVLAKVEEMGQMDNTLVFFMVDNGSCPFDNGGRKDPKASLGSAASYPYLPPEWACAGNTPWKYYKQYGYSGGARAPLIAYWPGVIEPGITNQAGNVVDIMPTLLDAAGIDYPETARGNPTPSLDGKSLLPLLKGKTRQQPDLIVSGFKELNRMVQIGNWKIVRVKNSPWRLYNMAEDPSETNDLAHKYPERVNAMEKKYKDWLKAEDIKPN